VSVIEKLSDIEHLGVEEFPKGFKRVRRAFGPLGMIFGVRPCFLSWKQVTDGVSQDSKRQLVCGQCGRHGLVWMKYNFLKFLQNMRALDKWIEFAMAELWEDITTDPIAETGFPAVFLEDVYQNFCGPNTPITSRQHLFRLLYHYKVYPISRVLARTFNLSCRRTLHRQLKDAEDYLYQVLDELRQPFLDRFDEDNRCPEYFDYRFKSMLDAVPIYIRRPKRYQRAFYNGKYKRHCLKLQCITDWKSRIIWYSGPHIGSTHDLSLFVRKHPPRMPHERILADLGYFGRRGRRLGLVTPFKRNRHGELTDRQSAYNFVHCHFRSSVERVFGFVKRFMILSQRHRGHVTEGPHPTRLSKAIKILIHLDTRFKTLFATNQ
jgi:hypothetical protein